MVNEIHIIIRDLKGGGAERVCVNLCNNLVKQGINVNLVLLTKEIHFSLDPNVNIDVLNTKHARTSVLKLFKYLKKNKINHVISFNYQITLILIFLRWIGTSKFKIATRHISNLKLVFKERNFWHGKIIPFFLRFFYKKSDFVIAQAERMKEELLITFKIPANKIKVIPNPISNQFLEVSPIPIKDRENNILFVGRLSQEKQVDQIILMFNDFLHSFPEFNLVIIGDGKEETTLKDLVKKLNIGDKVRFISFNKKLEKHLINAKLTVLASVYEGFPNALVESIAAGTPVVSYDSPTGPSEIIQNGVNGYLVEYGNKKSFIESMELALQKTNWEIESIRNSVSQFHPTMITNKYIKLFN